MKNRLVTSTPIRAAILLVVVSAGLFGFVSIAWSSIPMIVGCYLAGGIAVLAFRDYSRAPGYSTSNVHRFPVEHCAVMSTSVRTTEELRAA